MNDYITETKKMFYKHEVSIGPACNTYSMHTHNCYELIYFISGNATHVIEDRKYKLKSGDLILIRPFRYHFIQIDAPEDYERYDILFDAKKHDVESALLMPDNMEVVNVKGNSIVSDIFKKLDLYRDVCDTNTFESLLSNLLSELFYNIHLFPIPAQKEGSALSPVVSKALQYINNEICTVQGIEEIANHLFVSESYLFRRFKKELHRTPKEYIREKRLLLAREMITGGERPIDVAVRCGFSDYTTFYRNYKRFFGCLPSESYKEQ